MNVSLSFEFEFHQRLSFARRTHDRPHPESHQHTSILRACCVSPDIHYNFIYAPNPPRGEFEEIAPTAAEELFRIPQDLAHKKGHL